MKTYTEQDLREALATLAPAEPSPADMWPGVKSRISRRRRVHVALAAAVVAAATAFAVVNWPGATPDRISPVGPGGQTELTLGLGGSLPRGVTIDTITEILNARLNMLGVSDATVGVHDGHILVSLPSAESAKLRDLSHSGQLQLRQVLEVTSQPGSSDSRGLIGASADLNHAESLFTHGRCAIPPGRSRVPSVAATPENYLVACSADGTSEYLFGPSTIGTSEVTSAQASLASTANQWVVIADLNQAGAAAWQTLTAAAVQQPLAPQCQPPGGCNGIGVLVDGRVVTVPSVQSGKGGIHGDQVQIAPIDNQAEARLLAAELAHPLPVALTVESLKNSG